MFLRYLLVFIISMLPIVELRGALPVAVSMGLPTVPSYIVAIIGNMLPVPFIFLFARKVLEWGKDKRFTAKFFTWCLKKGQHGGEKLLQTARGGVYVALFLFVAIPIPGTGAWTGTLAASFLNLDFRRTTLAVLLGVLTAGVIMLLISLGVFSLA